MVVGRFCCIVFRVSILGLSALVSVRVMAGALLASALLSISSSLLFSQMSPRVIYGEDDRLDLYQLDEGRMLELSRSTALLVNRAQVRKHDDEKFTYQLLTEKLGKRFGLCRREAFWSQPSAGSCSGFLVGKDVLVTAAHCFLDVGACETTAVVFDYAYLGGGSDPTLLTYDSVYYCEEVLERVFEVSEGLDFAVLRLDREVQGRAVLPLRTRGRVASGEMMTVIGHPLGLPTKISRGKVRSVRDSDYFVINADLWEVSSGSPAFNARTGTVDGLVARGEEDFVLDVDEGGSCRVSKVCGLDACEGEEIIRATKFVDFVLPYL